MTLNDFLNKLMGLGLIVMFSTVIIWWFQNAYCVESKIFIVGLASIGYGLFGGITFEKFSAFFGFLTAIGLILCVGLAWYLIIVIPCTSTLLQVFLYAWLFVVTVFLLSLLVWYLNL